MKPKQNRQEFRVEVNGMNLTKEQSGRVNKAVQRAVLQELANLGVEGSFRTTFGPFGRLPFPWPGMIIDKEFPRK